MAVSNQVMTLAPRQLNDLDESLLDLLYEGRVTPALAKTLLAEREIAEVSRQYINQRLGRLAEHENVRNIEESGVYELVADPRSGGDAIAGEQFKRLSVALGTPITVGDVVYEDGDKHPLSSDDEVDG